MTEHAEALGLEQKMIQPGHWRIEGYDAYRVSALNLGHSYGTEWQLVDSNGSWITTKPTLREIRDYIRSQK